MILFDEVCILARCFAKGKILISQLQNTNRNMISQYEDAYDH